MIVRVLILFMVFFGVGFVQAFESAKQLSEMPQEKAEHNGMTDSEIVEAVVDKAGVDIEVGVNGMVCSFCAQGMTRSFEALENVERVAVSLTDAKVYLWLKENQALADQEIKDIITYAGYETASIKRN